MSLKKIHLRKLLQIMYASDSKRIALLREDIRNDIYKEAGAESEGGDFFRPFWSDAKRHVAGDLDLKVQTDFRIEKNGRRKRLYPLLRDGFLTWWNEKRRWINEPFKFLTEQAKAQFPVPAVDGLVKIENILAVRVGDESNRLIYPYFSEEPFLQAEAARLGLWVLSSALTRYSAQDIRILDVLRGASFSLGDLPIKGNEEAIFTKKYEALVTEWEKLKDEYK